MAVERARNSDWVPFKHDCLWLMARREAARIRVLVCTAMTRHPAGAQFEILIDGKPRAYCARKAVAIEAAQFLKQQDPHSDVVVKDLHSGEMTVAACKSKGTR